MSADTPDAAGSFSLFQNDGFNRLLDRIGLDRRRAFPLPARIVGLVSLTWGVPALFAWVRKSELGIPGHDFFYDAASWAQFLGFLPLALLAEPFIDDKMRTATRHLHIVVPEGPLRPVLRGAVREAHSRTADRVCLGLAYLFTLLWAVSELTNGKPTWHATLTSGRIEQFTAAGAWITFISLPCFTFLWLRWTWKVIVWTRLLGRVSRLPLRLHPAHPDRTGGLGCLSAVQTSFALILFGTGILFSAATYYKIAIEGTPASSYTVWLPIVGYVLLAPGVFLAPLFLFTKPLHVARREALLRYSAIGAAMTQSFEQRWVNAPRGGKDALQSEEHSALADFRMNFEVVERMRVVPFDLRSVLELFGSAAGPFLPLADLLELPEKVRAALSLIS